MSRKFHLAVGQSPAELSSTEQRLDWLRATLSRVAKRGADLLLLPELFASGYNIGVEVEKRAQSADGDIAKEIARLAKAHSLAIHYGFPEAAEGKIFNSAQCFGPDGACLSLSRKLLIPPGFERDYFSPGQEYSLFTYRDVRIATLICYDAEFPETARHLALSGVELILVPTALGAQWEWVAQKMIPSRAYENGVFLAYANSAGIEHSLEFLGQSFIATPDGQELARAGAKAEVIYGVLDIQRVTAAQLRLPYLSDRKLLETVTR